MRIPLPLTLLLFCAQAAAISAQIRIQNPSIPNDEHLVYSEKIGSESRTVSQDMRLKTEKGRSWYELTSQSPESELLMRMDPTTLFPSYSETVTHGKDSVIRRTNEFLSVSAEPKANELVIADFNSLPVIMRGFPWGTVSSAHLVMLGSMGGMSSFSVELSVKGKETVKIDGTAYECWKVQLGASGFLGSLMGSLMGKSLYWFSTDPTHYLVRAEGPSGGPGSQPRILELQTRAAR